MAIRHDYCFVFRKLEDIALGQPAGRIELDSTCMVFSLCYYFQPVWCQYCALLASTLDPAH